jgi:hypothetical protein
MRCCATLFHSLGCNPALGVRVYMVSEPLRKV